MSRAGKRFFAGMATAGLVCFAAALLEPVGVCEVLAASQAFDQRVVALLGRFSFREHGRFLSEEACGGSARQGSVRVVFDSKDAPQVPPVLEIDAALLRRKLKAMKQRTALAKFPFGTVDYDRWAVVYGRLEMLQDSRESAIARLHCRGESAIVFIPDE